MSKVMISLTDGFLQDMDAIAKAEHRNRSELVREAIRTYLATRGGARALSASREAQRAAARILHTRVRWSKGRHAASLVRQMRRERYGA
jgi:metal-responsive CopG/Arc/MetJ family transcriptional regulator